MHEHDGASSSTVRRRWPRPALGEVRVVARISAALGLLLMGLISLAGSASAAPAAPIGTWVSAGASVDLGDGATWYSDRAGAAVGVACVDGSEQVKVKGYFGQGEDVLAGGRRRRTSRSSGGRPRSAPSSTGSRPRRHSGEPDADTRTACTVGAHRFSGPHTICG